MAPNFAGLRKLQQRKLNNLFLRLVTKQHSQVVKGAVLITAKHHFDLLTAVAVPSDLLIPA